MRALGSEPSVTTAVHAASFASAVGRAASARACCRLPVAVLSRWARSLRHLLIRSGSAVNVASLFYLTPPSTALIAWAMFGETLTGLALVGMGLTVFGVWLARK